MHIAALAQTPKLQQAVRQTTNQKSTANPQQVVRHETTKTESLQQIRHYL